MDIDIDISYISCMMQKCHISCMDDVQVSYIVHDAPVLEAFNPKGQKLVGFPSILY